MSALNTILLFQFIKKLNTPFDKWPAYKLGIIDAQGNVLKKKVTLRTAEENNAWERIDIMICNIKKLLAKLPGGQTRLATAAASIYLLKETREIVDEELLIETIKLYEDVAANAVGGGAIASLGVPAGTQFGEPSPRTKRKKQLIRRALPHVEKNSQRKT